MTRDEEAEILAAARAGDRRKLHRLFERIFDRYRERIFATCLRLTGNAADAEDAVQECFVSVLHGLRHFRGDAQIYTWIYRIAIRAANRIHARRHRLAQRHEPTPPDTLPTDDPTVEGGLVAAEEAEVLLEEIAALPLASRTVLALCAVEGENQQRVAEILGIPEGTVWSRLSHARSALRERLRRRRNPALKTGNPD